MSKPDVWPLGDIKIGSRVRNRLGDIGALAKSIETVGLLHPIVVQADGQLVAGFRRLRAVERIGWTKVPVTVAHSVEDEIALLTAERDENTCREDFTTAEVHEIAARLLKQEKEAAKARKADGSGKRGAAGTKAARSADSAEPAKAKPKDREPEAIERVAKAVGVGKEKLRQIEAVYEAADEDPKLAPVKESLEREEKAAPAHTIATEWTPKQRKAYAKLWDWGWENSQVLAYAKVIEQMPEDEQDMARALLLRQPVRISPGDGVELAKNVASMPSKKRAKLYELHASEDSKDRDAAISLAVGNPASDPRVPRLMEMTQVLRAMMKRWPDDACNASMARAAKVLDDLIEEMRENIARRVSA